MKAKIRIATDMYEFIELDVEGAESAIWDTYKSMKSRVIHQAPGLTAKEFNEVIDLYLTENTMDSNSYEKMNDHQKSIIQEIKKSFKRINSEEL